jgi:hypothetical protein
MKVHAEPQTDDRKLEQELRETPGVELVGVHKGKPVDDSSYERQGRRHKSAGTNYQAGKKEIPGHISSIAD